MADWYVRGGPRKSSLKVCPGCRNLVRADEEFCPLCAKRLRAEGGLAGTLRKAFSRPDATTILILGLIGLGFVLTLVADIFVPERYRDPPRGGLNILVANFVTYIRMGSDFHFLTAAFHQYWRLLTHCFLHFGLIHLVFNCWCLRDLGRLVERLWGGRQLFATFVLTGIAGGAASVAWYMYVLGAPGNSAGASGAICGVLGLVLGAYFRNKYHVGEMLGAYLLRWAATIIVFGLLMRADNAAHIGGMAAGVLLGYVLPPTNHSRDFPRDKKIWTAAAVLSVALLLVSAGFAAAFFFAHGPQDLLK